MIKLPYYHEVRQNHVYSYSSFAAPDIAFTMSIRIASSLRRIALRPARLQSLSRPASSSAAKQAPKTEAKVSTRAPRTISHETDICTQDQHTSQKSPTATTTTDQQAKKLKKTQTELDQELMQKMAAHAGDGGESGVEYEDGVPVSMKRSVKSNMFRYI